MYEQFRLISSRLRLFGLGVIYVGIIGCAQGSGTRSTQDCSASAENGVFHHGGYKFIPLLWMANNSGRLGDDTPVDTPPIEREVAVEKGNCPSDYFNVFLESNSPVAECVVRCGKKGNCVELTYTPDWKVVRRLLIPISRITPKTDEEEDLARRATIRTAGFQAGFLMNYGKDQLSAIVRYERDIVPAAAPTAPKNLTTGDKAIWLDGWRDGCTSGYFYAGWVWRDEAASAE